MSDFTEVKMSDLNSEQATKQLLYANMVASINIIKKLPGETYENLMLPVKGVENSILACMNLALRKDKDNLKKTLINLDTAVDAVKGIINALLEFKSKD